MPLPIEEDSAKTDEAALIRRIAQQEQIALAQLYDRYARTIYAIAFRILGSVEEAEEVVLDVFHQVWRTSKCYDATKGRVDAWLFVLTRSRSLDRLRALSRLTKAVAASVEAAQLEPKSPVIKPEEDAILAERRGKVLAALAQIPIEQRQVIELAYYKGMTQEEIAAQTCQPLGTVKTRIRLGLSKLRKLLGAL